MPEMSGARALVEALKVNDVDMVLGLTGHSIMEVVDALGKDNTIRTVYTRTETSATYMGCGYNLVKGGPRSVCLLHASGVAHSAPGIMLAHSDSVPLVVVGGNVVAADMGKNGFQETPSTAIYAPITKTTHRIERTEDIPETLDKAFTTAGTGRQGPVFVDVPFDKFVNKAEVTIPAKTVVPSPPGGDPAAVREALDLIRAAKSPVILAGGGTVAAGASAEVQKLAELLCIPVAGGRSASKGIISEDHPLSLGTSGSFGWPPANEALKEADCWLAVGCTFSQVAMQDWTVEPPATLIHIDIDPREIGKLYKPTLGIVGDAKVVLGQMVEELSGKANGQDFRQHPRFAEVNAKREAFLSGLAERVASDAKPIDPFRVMGEIQAVLPEDGIITGGAGNNGEFAVHAIKSFAPRTFLLSQKYSPVGCSFPIALGAKLAAPDRPVICVDGDGGFLYYMGELATAVMEKIGVVVVVMNDGHFNANRHIARHMFDNNQVWTRLNDPDFVAIAKAFGADGERVEDPGDIGAALKRGIDSGGPYVIDMVIDPDVGAPITGKLWKIRW